MFKFVDLVMAFAPVRHRRRDRGDGGDERARRARSLGHPRRHAVRRADRVRAARAASVALLFRVPIKRFWKHVKEPWLIAFSTASCEAALPLAMERHGAARRAEADRRVRAADGILVQSRR